MTIQGRVVKGRGMARNIISKHIAIFEEMLGFRPYLGTLNIELDTGIHYSGSGSVTIEAYGRDGCKGAICYPCSILGIEAFVVRPMVGHYPKDRIELIASVNLKERLGLRDGDSVRIELE